MGTITNMVQQCMERFWQKQRKLDELTPPGGKDIADYCHERNQKYGISELRVLAVIQPQTDDDIAAPAPRTFGDLMECLYIVPRILQMLQGTSPPGSSHIRLGSSKPLLNPSLSGLAAAVKPDLSPIDTAKPVEPVSFYPCI